MTMTTTTRGPAGNATSMEYRHRSRSRCGAGARAARVRIDRSEVRATSGFVGRSRADREHAIELRDRCDELGRRGAAGHFERHDDAATDRRVTVDLDARYRG